MRILLTLLITLFIGQQIIAQNGSGPRPGIDDSISGKVVERSSNTPLEGVEIHESNTGMNYYTNAEGIFSVPYNGRDVWLTFTYPDYLEKQILITNAGPLTIVLSLESERSIDSKLAGFNSKPIRYRSDAFEYISTDHLPAIPHTSGDLMLQGHIAGIHTTATSGMPGEGAILNIRGITSLFGSNQPLILLDGMPYFSSITTNSTTPGNLHNPIKGIDVHDIQRIEVLKDGGSLYGTRGAGGVIMITTRQPENVNTSVNFSAQTGLTLQPENIKILNATQHKTYLVNQLQNTGSSFTQILQENPWITGNPSYFFYHNYNNETDWQNEVFRPAINSKFNVQLEGGDEIARFAVMLGYLNQQGIVENTGYQRYNFRLNSDISVLKDLSFISNIGFSYHISDLKNFGVDHTLNPVSASLVKGPMFAPFLRDNLGNSIPVLSDVDQYGFSNPSSIIANSVSNSYESNFLTNLKLLYQSAANLQFYNTIHVSFNNIRNNSFVPDYGISDINYGEFYNYSIQGALKNKFFANETAFDYKTSYENTHFFNSKGGFRISANNLFSNTGSVYNTPTDEFRSLSSVSLVENTHLGGSSQISNYSDIFLKSEYRFKDKYLVDLILTLSASSNTGKNAQAIDLFGGKWGFFPSLHTAWILSSEPFLKPIQSINLLKLRASYSITGNDYYTQQNRYSYHSRTYGLNSGLVRTFLPNETLKWEEVTQINTGLDAVLFKERFTVGVDYYHRSTNDLLVFKEVPYATGYHQIWENNGTLLSQGFELTTEFYPVKGDFHFKVGGNLSISKSTVSIESDIILNTPGGTVILRNGETPFSYFGLKTNGIYTSSNEAENTPLVNETGYTYRAGDIKFVDNITDGIIDAEDRVILGSLHPDMIAGLYISFGFRKLNIYALGEYSGGNQLFNYTRMKLESFSGYENQSIAAQYAWKNENDVTSIPRIAYGDPAGNASFSDRWLESGAFMRLREVTVSYDLPQTGFYNNIRIFVSGQNLLTSTQYLGYYPEFAYTANPALQSADYGRIPITPQIIGGIKVGF